MKHVHVIPVDPSLSVEDAWRELCIMGLRTTVTGEPTWATVQCDGEECQSVQCEHQEHPHPETPCGQRIVDGITSCRHCGNLDGSPECEAAGCWQPVSQADVDALICEAKESEWRLK